MDELKTTVAESLFAKAWVSILFDSINIKATMKRCIYVFTILMALIFQSCGLKMAKEVGLRFSTEKSKLPDTLNWRKIGFAKELLNQKK